ncbi:MAG: signal peptide peptidase SppA [Candidatus Aminicenantes bacterium]|nr:signal peptide peptidase SppA [Candidatus Aminicenantes bacterium]
MRKGWAFAALSGALLLAAGCAPHFHLDFLGKDKIQEITLLPSKAKEKILVIDVEGMIGPLGQGGLLDREGDALSRVYYRLEKASMDALVKGVILRLDTPGGDVTSSDVLTHEIRKFKEKKRLPVVALMMGVAASGGYYVATACDSIVAHPSTITGSIGVISVFPNIEGLFAKVGVKTVVIKSGGMKDAGSPFRGMSAEEQQIFQEVIDEFYENFLRVVEERRKDAITREELRKIADGRIYTAAQALELKLIDSIGYFDDALAEVLSRAALREAKIVAYSYYPKRQTNLYATALGDAAPLPQKRIEDVLPALKSGFYYLWLPHLTND